MASPLAAAVVAAGNADMQRIGAGVVHGLAIKPDASLWAWGDNTYGQLGNGTTGARLSPIQVLAGVAGVAAGYAHTLALKPDGSLWAWGANWNGQLGDGTTTARLSPVQILAGVDAVAAGDVHTLALKSDGSLWASGANWSGQLGDGTTTDRLSPVQVLTGVAAVAAGPSHTLAIKSDGSLWAWGGNWNGQLGDGTTTDRWSPVQVLSGVAAVAGGVGHTLAIKTDGSLWAWGWNGFGQLGDGTTTDRWSPVQVPGSSVPLAPDFVVTGVVLTPSSPAVNGTFSAAVTVTNKGASAGMPGVLQVWADQSGVQACGAKADQVAILPSLAADASQTFTFSGLPAGLAGTKTLRAFVDSTCLTAEANEANNQYTTTYDTFNDVTLTVAKAGTGSGAIGGGGTYAYNTQVTPTASAAPGSTFTGWMPASCGSAFALTADTTCIATFSFLPDFVVTSVFLTPSSPTVNATVTAKVTVTNKGAVAGTPGVLQVWADQATAQGCGAKGDQSVILPSLAAGASQTVGFIRLAVGVAGVKTVRAFVDSQCLTAETDEANNQSTASYTVAPPAPDFVVSTIVLTPASPTVNGTFSATVTVTNKGTAAGTSQIEVWADQAAAQSCGANGGRVASPLVSSLAAGASRTFTLTGLSAGVAGTKTLRAFVDFVCMTAESDETNNQAVLIYSVIP
ncbi:CARDB domain-containing protein [uncultured Thiodictyon sp.]|uniref:CARDB domain-containing protein n=1 Tax=uncultured Thiodictyon sp. TaxID=1846217 RepID=UPI0025CD13FA|nr:CARDB domain-containing protein [uncultured Thiodictyon sp.]